MTTALDEADRRSMEHDVARWWALMSTTTGVAGVARSGSYDDAYRAVLAEAPNWTPDQLVAAHHAMSADRGEG